MREENEKARGDEDEKGRGQRMGQTHQVSKPTLVSSTANNYSSLVFTFSYFSYY